MSQLKGFDRMFRLDGKVALITGGRPKSAGVIFFAHDGSTGSRGLGLHTATAFLKAGASTVVICARKADGPNGIDQAVEKLNALPESKDMLWVLLPTVQMPKTLSVWSWRSRKLYPSWISWSPTLVLPGEGRSNLRLIGQIKRS